MLGSLGQYSIALAAADEMIASLPARLLRVESPPLADWLEGFVPMKMHAQRIVMACVNRYLPN